MAHLGVGAPAGSLGGDVDLAPLPAFAVSLGAGLSPSSGGPQLALIPRLRFPIRPRTFFTVGTGASVGRYVSACDQAGLMGIFCGMGESSATQTWEPAFWYDFEIGIDAYSRNGPGLFRSAVGYGHVLNAGDYSCDEGDHEFKPGGGCDRSGGKGLVYVMLAYGFRL